jgi:hypothetical protein
VTQVTRKQKSQYYENWLLHGAITAYFLGFGCADIRTW